jgi:hypothetical protein
VFGLITARAVVGVLALLRSLWRAHSYHSDSFLGLGLLAWADTLSFGR